MAGVAQCLQVKLIDPANASSVAALVASPDNLSVQANSSTPSTLPVSTSTDLAAHVPGTSLLYLQVPDLGPTVHDLVSCLRTNAPDAFSSKSVQQIETGSRRTARGRVQRGRRRRRVGRLRQGQHPVGPGVQRSDQGTAQNRLTTLVTVIRLASVSGNLPATVSQLDGDGDDRQHDHDF